MAQGKAKINSSVSLTPPQPRSLRSRKRECPSDDTSETVQDTHHQDTEGNGAAVDPTLLQCHQCPLQESTMTPTKQYETEDQPCLTKQDPNSDGKHAEPKYLMVKALEEQDETTLTNPKNDSQEGFRVHVNNDVNKSGKVKEELTAEECSRSLSQICTDLLQVFSPVSEPSDGAALEEQVDAKKNSKCHLEKNQEASQEEPNNDMADVKEIAKEAAVVLPAKKKRRMGMCGLTERERSHFLQTQKRENGQNGMERVEKQICDNTADIVSQEEIISSSSSSLSIPPGSVTEQDEAETKLQSSHCGGDDRAETDIHIAAATSDGTSVTSDPGRSKGKSCEVEGAIVPGPEQTDDTVSDPPAQEELFGNQEQQERKGGTAEIVAEKPEEQMKGGEGGSAAVDQSPAITFYSNPTEDAETENQDAIEGALLQVNSVTRTRDEKKEELIGDVGDRAETGASSKDTQSGGFNAVELCEAAATPSGSERKDKCYSDGEPGAGPSTEPPQTRDTADPFGSGYLDYVSDSQLNTIVLIEEEVEREEDLDSPDHEDATDLICGLIGELSSLNRKVMATQRELENLRRNSKSSRSSLR